jgi:hypothetical protein
MKVVAWNVGPRFWRKILRSLAGIRAMKTAKITALFEASNPALVAALRARYPHRRVICHHTDAVAILKRGGRRPRVEVVSHDVTWRGPHLGRPKRGRRWLHRVTPIGNEAAWDAETDLIRSIVKRVDLPDELAIIGDHNGTRARLCDDYADMGLRLLPVNAKVDHCAVRDLAGGGIRLGNHGSDHVAIEWRLRDHA